MINKDTGSLVVTAEHAVVGTKIQISGETKIRTVTYVMAAKAGATEKHVCFKGQGPVPTGEISYEVVA